jgi:hypothetical protein
LEWALVEFDLKPITRSLAVEDGGVVAVIVTCGTGDGAFGDVRFSRKFKFMADRGTSDRL